MTRDEIKLVIIKSLKAAYKGKLTQQVKNSFEGTAENVIQRIENDFINRHNSISNKNTFWTGVWQSIVGAIVFAVIIPIIATLILYISNINISEITQIILHPKKVVEYIEQN